MAYIYKQDHIPKSTQNNRRPTLSLSATTITIHNTGNPSSTAANERAWLTNKTNTRTASYHIVVDEKEAIEVLPLNEVGWHAGDGSRATSGNRTSIGIEICESGNYSKTLDNAIELIVKMLKERGWGIDKLKRHYDWNGKNCPRLMNSDGKWTGWFEFLKVVESKLKSTDKTTTNNNTYDLTKERISLVNGALKFHTLGDYSVKATDVRHIIIKKGSAEFSLAYEKGKKTSQIVTNNKADLGINCTFYNMSNGIPSGYFKGSDGIVRSSAYGKTLKWKQINLMGDYLELSNLDTSRDNASFQFAPLIVENGVVVSAKYIKEQEVNDDIAKSACQRTFMWWDKSGNTHLAVSDGRTNYDTGLKIKELVLYSIHHGAVNTCVFDGGGSSLLATDNNGAINQSLNTGANERTNHHALLITFKTEAESSKDKELTTVNVVVNGKLLEAKGLLIDNTTHVPLRAIGNAIGAKIGWNQTTKEASLNGVIIEGVIINSTTYVPLRKLGNLIGAKIRWDQTTKTASLTQ